MLSVERLCQNLLEKNWVHKAKKQNSNKKSKRSKMLKNVARCHSEVKISKAMNRS